VPGLTPKQERFAQEVAAGKSQSDAYRAAFNVRPTSKANSVHVSASQMMAHPKVALRLAELRAPAVEKAHITLDSHLQRLGDLSTKAEEAGQFAASISAEVARGKASGVHVEQTRTTSTVAVVKVNMSPAEFRDLAREMVGRI